MLQVLQRSQSNVLGGRNNPRKTPEREARSVVQRSDGHVDSRDWGGSAQNPAGLCWRVKRKVRASRTLEPVVDARPDEPESFTLCRHRVPQRLDAGESMSSFSIPT